MKTQTITSKCQCTDPDCFAHVGDYHCNRTAKGTLTHVWSFKDTDGEQVENETEGLRYCPGCAAENAQGSDSNYFRWELFEPSDPRKPRKYFVVWEMDAECDSPRQAAERARDAQRREITTATFFRVFDEHGTETLIDLSMGPND